jgi:hypothetical protein
VDFDDNLRNARTFLQVSIDDEADYWQGYLAGTRRRQYGAGTQRRYHGEAFGDPDEHAALLAAADDPDADHHWRGEGYRDGLDGRSAAEMAAQRWPLVVVMRQYTVHDRASGADLGTYTAAREHAAAEAMYHGAGYASVEAAADALHTTPQALLAGLVIREVHDAPVTVRDAANCREDDCWCHDFAAEPPADGLCSSCGCFWHPVPPADDPVP